MAWRFGVRLVPGLVSGSVSPWELLAEAPVLLFWLCVVWGLLALQRWAWWIAVLVAGLLAVAGIAVVFFAEEIQRRTAGVEPQTLLAVGASVALLSATVWLLLVLPRSRQAFRTTA